MRSAVARRCGQRVSRFRVLNGRTTERAPAQNVGSEPTSRSDLRSPSLGRRQITIDHSCSLERAQRRTRPYVLRCAALRTAARESATGNLGAGRPCARLRRLSCRGACGAQARGAGAPPRGYNHERARGRGVSPSQHPSTRLEAPARRAQASAESARRPGAAFAVVRGEEKWI